MAINAVDKKQQASHGDTLIRPLQRIPTLSLHSTLAKAIALPPPAEEGIVAAIISCFSYVWNTLCEWVYWLFDIKAPVQAQDLPPDPLKSIAGYLDYHSVVQLKCTSCFFAGSWMNVEEWERRSETIDHANYRKWRKERDAWQPVAFSYFRMQVISSGKWLKTLELILTELDEKKLKQLFPSQSKAPEPKYPKLQTLVLKTDRRDLERAAMQPDSLEEALTNVGFHCPELRTLSTSLLSSDEVATLVDRSCKLSALKVNSLCAEWNWREFAQCMGLNNGHVQELHLGKEATISTSENMLAVSTIDQLKSVSIVDVKAGDSEIAHFAKHPGLQEMRLSVAALSQRACEILGGLPNLTTLEIEDCSRMDQEGMALLAKGAAKLTRLILNSLDNINALLKPLDQAAMLTRLRLHNCHELTDEGLKALTKCDKLIYLKIYNTRRSQITDAGLIYLSSCRSLQQLKLARKYSKQQDKDMSWQNLTADGIRYLVKNRPSLKHFTVSLGHLSQEERTQLKKDLLALRPQLELA